MTLPSYDTTELDLPPLASWPASRHVFDAEQVHALRAAEAAGRPLLVRGDPGTGKSQLAHAAAVAAQRLLLSCVVDSRTEASDLMWRYDAVARLADAHLAGVPGSGITPEALKASHYIQPGPLWWAFDWAGADRQRAATRTATAAPGLPPADWQWQPARGTVLLIDEIDKAEAELPNGLLEALGNGRFSVPLADHQIVQRPPDLPPPLVIITTNDERELPAPFLRRCLVLTLKLPTTRQALRDHLVQRGRLHFGDWATRHDQVLGDAADMLLDDREAARRDGLYTPGLAEYLDLLRALRGLGGDPVADLAQLRVFAFRKQPSDRLV